MQVLFSFDQDMRVEKTLIQTLACQLSSTFMQLLFSFDQDMRVEKTLIQTLACQLSSTLMQLWFSFDQDMRVEKTLIQTLACQPSSTLMQLLFSFDQDMRVEKTLIQTLACQLQSTSQYPSVYTTHPICSCWIIWILVWMMQQCHLRRIKYKFKFLKFLYIRWPYTHQMRLLLRLQPLIKLNLKFSFNT